MKGHLQIVSDVVPSQDRAKFAVKSGVSEGLDPESGAVGDSKSMYDPNEGRAMKAPSHYFE